MYTWSVGGGTRVGQGSPIPESSQGTSGLVRSLSPFRQLTGRGARDVGTAGRWGAGPAVHASAWMRVPYRRTLVPPTYCPPSVPHLEALSVFQKYR